MVAKMDVVRQKANESKLLGMSSVQSFAKGGEVSIISSGEARAASGKELSNLTSNMNAHSMEAGKDFGRS